MSAINSLPGVYAMPGIHANSHRKPVDPVKLLLELSMKAAHISSWPKADLRRRKYLRARALFWWACKNMLHKPPTLRVQGKYVAEWNYDHATVMYWHETWANDLANDYDDAVRLTQRFLDLFTAIRAAHSHDLSAFKSLHEIPGITRPA